jgi:hypothetical protein
MKPIIVIPIGKDRCIYQDRASGRQFGRIVAGIGFPGRSPGYVGVFGEARHEDHGLGVRHVDLLHEVEATLPLELLQELADLESGYEVAEIWGLMDQSDIVALTIWSDGRNRREDNSTLNICKPPFADDDRIKAFIQILRNRLQPEKKSLHLGEGSILAQRLLELPAAEGISGIRAKDYPAAAAAGYALMAMSIWGPMNQQDLPDSYLSPEEISFFEY